MKSQSAAGRNINLKSADILAVENVHNIVYFQYNQNWYSEFLLQSVYVILLHIKLHIKHK